MIMPYCFIMTKVKNNETLENIAMHLFFLQLN